MKKTWIHVGCGNEVTFAENQISAGDPEGGSGYYAAACLHCDEDLFRFEIEEANQ